MAINSELQAIHTLHQFIKEGGLTVITEFVFNERNVSFRTSLQLDGCVINFVPNPSYFSTPDAQHFLQFQLQQHLEKIKVFLTQIKVLNSLLQRVFYLLASGHAIVGALLIDVHDTLGQFHPFLAYLYEIHPYLVSLFWFIISGAMGGLIFYYIVIPIIWYFIAKKMRGKF